MQTPTEANLPERPYACDIAAGTVRVRILAAHIYESAVDGREIIEYAHRVQVTTDEGTGSGRKRGYVTVRGRRYRIDRLLRRERQPWVSPQGQPVRWSLSHIPYGGGFLNDRGSDVSAPSRVYEALRRIELDVLERFEAQFPDWRKVSERLSDLSECQRWQNIAATRRAELADAEQRITYFTARISS